MVSIVTVCGSGRLDAGQVGRRALLDVVGAHDARHAATGVARADLRVQAELERELDVGRGEVGAIRPLDARMELERPGLLVVRDLPRVGELGDERAVLAGERVLGDRVRHDAVRDEVLPDEVQELVVAAGTHRVHVVDADAARADEGAGELATVRARTSGVGRRGRRVPCRRQRQRCRRDSRRRIRSGGRFAGRGRGRFAGGAAAEAVPRPTARPQKQPCWRLVMGSSWPCHTP